ncbi:MAG: cytochrome c [Anaerolineae bacterium]|nr:cytochrome c [Anaerolineae bacterium]
MRLLAVCVLIALIIAACGAPPAATFADLPVGDAAHGAQLFDQRINGAPACSSCHTLDGSVLMGPSLQNYAAIAPVTEAGAASLAEYTFTSIVQPGAFVVSGFGNTMYRQYQRQLSPQDTADLIAYLLTL